MDFKTKIDKILKIKNIAVWRLAEIADLESTLEKAYNQNREMRPTTTGKFLKNMQISETFWETGEGEVFLNNGHREQGGAAEPVADFKRLLENGDYVGMHRKAFELLEASLNDNRRLLEDINNKNSELIKAITELARTLSQKKG